MSWGMRGVRGGDDEYVSGESSGGFIIGQEGV